MHLEKKDVLTLITLIKWFSSTKNISVQSHTQGLQSLYQVMEKNTKLVQFWLRNYQTSVILKLYYFDTISFSMTSV